MKKIFYLPAIAATLLGIASCSDDNEKELNPDSPRISTGAYVLNQGNYNQIGTGSFNVIDYSADKTSTNVFQRANAGMSLGDTPQCGVAYGSHIYIGVYVSSVVQVINRNDYKLEKTIKLPVEGVEGTQPRDMVANGGKVYISMYDGYVACLDTTSLNIEKSVKVGLNPETMALRNNCLYVPNSEGMASPGPYGKTASVIDLETFTVTKTFEVPENPVKFINTRDGLYLLCSGNYGDTKGAFYKIGDDLKSTYIADATIIENGKDCIYFINADFMRAEGEPIEYCKYTFADKKTSEWTIQKTDYPNWIGCDPVTGNILIGSYVMDGKYPSYVLPGYINVYNSKGDFLRKYDVGVGPSYIFFNAI